MGNSNHKIPENFKSNCHPALAICQIFEQSSIYMQTQLNSIVEAWKNTIEPLQKNGKHLFLPTRIVKIQQINEGCFPGSPDDPKVQIFFQPYIYTLDKEIISRKSNFCKFEEWEVWKIMENCVIALNEWKEIYPSSTIGKIKPINIVLNTYGKIKMVNQLTSPVDYHQPYGKRSINNRTLRQLHNNLNPVLILKKQEQGQSMKELGLTLLQILTLQKTPESDLTVDEKKQKLFSDTNYSIGLKKIVENLIYAPGANQLSIKSVLAHCKVQKYYRNRQQWE